ncbi:MAG: RelA/SpoT family protein [Candidatus Nanopelagicaceae bacterium]|jgi:GTP pyrophosphokinase|nr:bifunctional (p)ppGpp synthetase/guanosine-3',5'-bis(diphosphate) 3'-pyrophosphohydrolase [Actinomycetota bacterium]NCV83276.1 bifunctional (p)ppGpp synthetase/guanosine-3',5'-bis(diphosphate) 3'-pyrophosphohydrolase [Actinomycetota bacterium]NCV95138.1 bifunctional (p)ppGpp synthetase/guanosine-3',5'-bis(diphosphate) 3'-pyrophosphohydrolase [Actinomycetota bacterium]NCW93839.1 bifunctional (p)ppGpp synthetase/guanosine-3',5'-bis(diphosphate) 3'-pyrophosphohydrolase [Actinomycetota bacterium]
MSALLAPVAERVRHANPDADITVIERAFVRAEQAHEGQLRKSGAAYITHPVAVAEILADLGLDPNTIAAALLHDTVEDTPYSAELLRREFGDEIANLVDGVTKLDRLTYGPTAEAETVRKMVVAMAKDIRVLVIKLADRLHNARTWQYVSPESSARKARETLDIYAPLAHRLGMNAVKWELEDLSFKFLEPKKFEEIERLVVERSPSREKLTNEVIKAVEQDLIAEGINAKVTGRQKHLFSVYQKMVVRGREFNDIYDLVGIRVLVNDVRDCYAVLGAIHARWSPVPGRFKDYIAMPKFNLYQSLHTTVIGPTGKAVEIQIRTHEMHRRAEYGIAAHWKYKQGKTTGSDTPDVLWLKQLHEWQQETTDVAEFLDALRFDLRTPEVFVFTPKGSVIALPQGSTPVDFAYAVHTEVGNKCVGAKVNGKLVSLEAPLTNGDVIEVVTNKGDNAAPSRDWLNFVKSQRARSKIKAWFTRERREEAVDAGKESIARQMRKAGLPIQKILAGQTLLQLAHDLNYPDIESLYAAVGDGHISSSSVVEKLIASIGTEETHETPLTEMLSSGASPRIARRSASGVNVEGVEDVLIKLARCCTPVPGDPITGFITRGSGVSIHRSDCVNVADLKFHQGDRIVKVSWDPGAKTIFLVNIQIEALDRARLLSDITRALSDQEVNILHAAVNTTKDQTAISRFTFEMADASHLDVVLASIRKIDGVYDVYRITNN